MKGSKTLAMLVVMAMLLSTMVVLDKVIDFNIIESASAITPGIDGWEGNGSISGSDVLNTSTAGLFYMNDDIYRIEVNGSLSWGSATYYLYYPVYSGKYGSSYSLTWAKYMGDPDDTVGAIAPEIDADTSDYTFGDALSDLEKNVKLNRSGLWLIDNDGTHNASNASQMTATIPAWFWVNTSDVFTTSISDAEFGYGDAGSITISVSKGETTPSALLAVYNDTARLVGIWDHNEPFVDGERTLNKNSSVFTNAGTWYVHSYYDMDGGTGETGDHVSYLDGPGAGYNFYNASNYGSSSTINDSATTYYYAICGPWDPPEYNDTIKKITVETGKPTVKIVPAENATVYWGFETRLDINVTDSDGNGVTGGNISLRKRSGNDTHIHRGDYGDISINEISLGNYSIEIGRSASNWSVLVSGSWYVFFAKDTNGDGTEEYNNTAKFTIKSTVPSVDLRITSDGDAPVTDKKVDVQVPGAVAGPAGYIDIEFTILGRSVFDLEGRAYYGDNTTWEDYRNITISGDILYPVVYGTGTTLSATETLVYKDTGGNWAARVIPTKPGGTITITINWPGSNNGTDSETINIVNGTLVTTNIDKFTIGDDTYITATVESMSGTLQEHATVYLFWKGGGAINDTTGTAAAGKGANGEYTFWIGKGDQGTSAPKNITIAAMTAGTSRWGYTKVLMEKRHNIVVNCTPTSSYAGDATEYDIDILVDGAAPETYSDITVALYDSEGKIVTGDDAWSKTGSYNIDDEEIPLSGGTYQLYAYNGTHDSQGNNATITVTGYSVECSPSVLAWLIDTSTNITFQVTPARNGTLVLNNMSTLPNCSSKTAGVSDTNDVDIANGIGTLEDVNATTLGNVTFDYVPEDGEQRAADGLLRVTTATATPSPGTIYLGESTTVTVTVTHPATGAKLSGVEVGLDNNIALADSILAKLPDPKNTGTDGSVTFGITAEASGNVTIYIKNGTDPDNPFVIEAAARKTMTLSLSSPSVDEGGTFTVTAKSGGIVITDATVSILFAGSTYTTTTGTKDLTAPSVSTSLTYTIEATAEGYTSADASIMVLNVPKLTIVPPSKVSGKETFGVTVADESGQAIIGATVTFNGETYTTGANGLATLTAPDVTEESKEYTITATFTGYESATVTFTISKTPGVPGFELLTLIAAIGVAFILLRRRRR